MARFVSLLVIALFGSSFANETETETLCDYKHDLLLEKMDYFEYKLLEMHIGVKDQTESLLQKQEKDKDDLLEQIRILLEQQKSFGNRQKMMDNIFELRPRKNPTDNSRLIAYTTSTKLDQQQQSDTISSCQSEPTKKSGRYQLALSNCTNVEVYCEQSLYGGGWLVIQNRFNGSVDFYRNWTEYQNGFGSLDGEFWFGLDKIHTLTSSKNYELMIHLEDFNGLVRNAHYKKFKLGGSDTMYTLSELGAYNGTANDALTFHQGKKFSTYDNINDPNSGSGNCAIIRHGAWWYHWCAWSNLNGMYKNTIDAKTMSWYYLSNEYRGLKISKMMIREI